MPRPSTDSSASSRKSRTVIFQLPSLYNTYIAPVLMSISDIAEQSVLQMDPALVESIDRIWIQFVQSIGEIISSVSVSLVGGLSSLLATSLPGLFIKLLLMIISTFFIAVDYRKLTHFILRQLSPAGKHILFEIKQYIVGTLFVCIRSYALIMSITFVELAIGLSIIGVDRAVLIALGLFLIPGGMVKGFQVFGKIIVIIITIGLAAAIIQELTPLTLIPGLNPISDGVEIVGDIAIVLAGAFPLVFVITKVFRRPLMKLGGLLGMNDVAAAGMVATLANNIPMFQMMGGMDRRGKIINVAFAVSASFVFGDHLGFTAGFDATMLFPMIVGKLVGGVTAVAAAMLLTRKDRGEDRG